MSHPADQRPQPHALAPNEAAMYAIAEAREAAIASQTAVDRLLEFAVRQDAPPELRVITLSAAEPTETDRSRWRSRGIGIFNWSPATVYLGIGGVSPRASSSAVSVPASSMLILPADQQELELGVDPADVAGGDASFLLMRFQAAPAPFFGGV